MQEKKWFILDKEKISGPFTPADIFARLKKGEIKEALFWAKQKNHWMLESEFRSEIEKDAAGLLKEHQSRTINQWKVKTAEKELGPFSYEELMDFLKKQMDLGNIKIWTQGFDDWQDIYSNFKIMDDLGISRRQHPRVPIQGSMIIEHTTGLLEIPLSMISQGGCGITHGYKLSIGDKFKGTIISPSLPNKIHCAAEVVYLGSEADCGLKFTNISTEGKASIIDYVRKLNP